MVVDDDEASREAVVEAFTREGYLVAGAASGREGLRLLAERNPDVVLTDLVMPEVDGLEILRAARATDPPPEVFVMTGYASIESAVEAMRSGAYDYLAKPLRLAEVKAKVEKALERRGLAIENKALHQALDEKYGFERLLGTSRSMEKVFETIRQVAPTSATILLTGESGTGKELIARAVHAASPRRVRPFLAFNCGALAETLIESELFGHEKGAFTGAVRERKGYFELADGGTLLLDEIGDMPLALQTKLLRVLETREFYRVGGTKPVSVDVRIVAATNQDLEAKVAEGTFREDLFFRLAVVQVTLPPLRERREDVPLLAEAFLKEFCEVHGRPNRRFTSEAMSALVAYDWPGNVRELRNLVESLVVTTSTEEIGREHLPEKIAPAAPAAAPPAASGAAATGVRIPEGATMEEVEKEAIRQTLERTGWNRTRAAKALGIGERTIQRKIKSYGLSPTGQNGGGGGGGKANEL